VAVATLLLVGSGLAIRSLRESAVLNPGFSATRVQVISASPDLLGYDEARGRALWNEIVERASRVSGVESASLALFVPLGSRGDLLGMSPADKRSEERRLAYNIVRPGYLDMLGVRLVAGRDLSPNDVAGSPDVVVVSEAMARRFFGSPNAVGRSIFISGRGGPPRFATVVGVVADIKLRSMGEPPGPIAYLPFGQWYRADMVLHLRLAADADQVMPRVIEQVRAVEPDLALEIQPMSRATEFSMIPLRVAGTVLGFCGIVGVVLAGLGVFGLVAYAVSLRTREIGIRVALGAGRSALTRLVALQALRPVTVGLVVGLTLSVALAGAIRGLLVNVGPIDPVALGASATVLLGAAALALVTPLRRAIGVNPVEVLRSE
jgi:predicted permease